MKAMSLLSPRLQLKLAQKHNPHAQPAPDGHRASAQSMELKEMINQEIVENPVLRRGYRDGRKRSLPRS